MCVIRLAEWEDIAFSIYVHPLEYNRVLPLRCTATSGNWRRNDCRHACVRVFCVRKWCSGHISIDNPTFNMRVFACIGAIRRTHQREKKNVRACGARLCTVEICSLSSAGRFAVIALECARNRLNVLAHSLEDNIHVQEHAAR